MIDYMKMSDAELRRIMRSNPNDVPHYQRADRALTLKHQRWGIIIAALGLVAALVKLLLH